MKALAPCNFAFNVFDLHGIRDTFFSNMMMKAISLPIKVSMASSLSKFIIIIK